MSYAFHYDVPADEEFYRRVVGEIGDEQPKGLIVHLVVKRDDGLRHIEVWESEQDWQHYRRGRIEPALDKVFAAAGVAERPPQPREQQLDLVDVWLGS